MQKLRQVLTGDHQNHILPFLWVHGEDADTLRTEIARIQESGIGAVCVEARPHKDFGGEGWYADLGVILEECRRRGMKMWLLDDSHFPTGFANGEVKKNHPELCKKFLCLKTLDFAGPVQSSGALLKYMLQSPDDQIIGLFLQRRTGFERIDVSDTIEVTQNIKTYPDYNTGKPNVDLLGNIHPGTQGPCTAVEFDLPEGDWSLNVLTVSYKGGEKETEGYLNPLDPAATQILIDTVYQPVYDRFGDEFGKTFMGFFSDEPRFGNIHGTEGASIGRNSAMNLPWRDDLLDLLAARCAGTALDGVTADGLRRYLPLLFIGDGETAHALRYLYMDLVSALYSENFDGVLGNWCHDHGCMRIGHCIEDNDATARLGYGPGHIFRAMAHADMAGIDVVIHQLLPGMDKDWFKGFHRPGWDGEFFTYVLGKLGGSMARMDPIKQGRCMCELFGAYGWAEGNRLGKWLVDYMLVRGVNELVPHAFDPAPFPDGDCPPHFYAHGCNPQYPEFRLLMAYANRLAELLSGGRPCVPAAVLFHAEAEWSGAYMPTQKPAAALGRAFIDYDILPADYLLDRAALQEGVLAVHTERFKALVVPYAEALPAAVLAKLAELAAAGFPVVFVDALPDRASEGVDAGAVLTTLRAAAKAVPLERLAEALTAAGIPELTLDAPQSYLRSLHVTQPDGEVYFFVNEHPSARIQATVCGGAAGHTYVYDALTNELTADEKAFTLDLPPYGSKLVIVTEKPLPGAADAAVFTAQSTLPLDACTVALAGFETGCTEYGAPITLDKPQYVSTLLGYEAFAGRIRYTFPVTLSAAQARVAARLVLDGVREGAAVAVNGTDCGTRICPDYVYDLTGTLREGENTIEVTLNTTLGRALNDFMSQFMPIEPTGLAGAMLKFGGI